MYTLLTSLDPSSIPSSLTPPKVIVFSSANPSFWIGHYDINLILPNGTSLSANETTALFEKNVAVARALGTLPTIFIAEINGRTTGSGGEFLLQCDMAFAGPDAVLGSMEGAVGGLQGNGGIQYLVRRVGMARAAEYLLQATSIGAQEAAEVGWVNRAFESEDRLREGVDEIVYRLSLLPAGGLNGTKSAIRANGPSVEQADADVATILRLFPDEIGYLPRLIELSENQTAGEFELGALRDIKDVERLHGVE
ncbi:ClpP/crotonase [Polyplosphaeria fusca]|uniref:ClpP/crotonase n=1 Tax=Polyplosphaeria fusca TaxID=682080 RepID=A0A9P4QSI4_9PLEO|nr:ClpP/crotonase [Polyplosphaeria fusca]